MTQKLDTLHTRPDDVKKIPSSYHSFIEIKGYNDHAVTEIREKF